MLFYIIMFIVVSVASIASVWLYRRASEWGGKRKRVVGPSDKRRPLAGMLQGGFIGQAPASRKRKPAARRPSGGVQSAPDAIRKPWGW